VTIIGAHTIIFSTQPEADRAFLRDVLHLSFIDDGDGWLIFALPPAELAVHPDKRNNLHRLYLMCDDFGQFLQEMKEHGIACGEVTITEWGHLANIRLPGGGKLDIYQPLHHRPSETAINRYLKMGGGVKLGQGRLERVWSFNPWLPIIR
jgi:hypothetical protein